MVSLQDLPYSRLLSVPDDDEREFLALEELKPHHLTELSGPHSHQDSSIRPQYSDFNHLSLPDEDCINNVYYDLNAQQPNGQCSLYVNSGSVTDSEMTAGNNFTSNLSMDTSNSNTHENFAIKGARKRKFSYNEVSDLDDDDARSIRTTDENKKANHSEIEKRRRDKMNNFITELSSMIPMCNGMSRKLDKLTVLRMAVQHLKVIRGANSSYVEPYKPAFLSDQELKMLILQAAEGFLFVVGCDRGRILYVSESVSEVLKGFNQKDLLGQSWFDILHPKDVAKIKEQLSSSEPTRERLIDAKTMLPVKNSDMPQGSSHLCPGARRSFFCRMKCKNSIQVKEENDSSSSASQIQGHRRSKKHQSDKKFCVIQCTGYLKSWAPAKMGLEQESEAEGGDCNLSLSCLVAVGRLVDFNNGFFNPNSQKNKHPSTSGSPFTTDPVLRNIQFTSRHAMDGKFLFVDQRATLVLGFLPQELLGTSMYEYFNHKDISALSESHKVALQSIEKVTTPVYGFRTKHNGFINVQSEWKSFKNPWTKDVEFLVATNNVILSDLRNYENEANRGGETSENYDFFNQTNGREMQRMINTHIEASKIGRQIADQVLDYQRRVGDISSDSSPDPDPTLAQTVQSVSENQLNASLSINGSSDNSSSALSTRVNGNYANFTTYNHSRSSTVVSPENVGSSDSSQQTGTRNDGNDEAAMAVIMSLLEADAGLGGPIDFSGLPWPLP